MNNFHKFLVISVLIHLLLLLFLKFPKEAPLLFPQSPKILWMDLKKHPYEVVDLLPPAEESRPKDSKFVGMYDMSAEEETVAAHSSRGDDSRKNRSPVRRGDSRGTDAVGSVSDDGMGPTAGRTPTQDFDLPEDFYPDFRRGSHTYLNVLRFPDVQYFVRLKRVFKMTWNPEPPLRIAAFNTRINRGTVEVVLGVSVDRKGNLAEAFVYRSSGIGQYDEEALRTIRASSPFSVPPAKLLEGDGLLRMSWTFTVYL